MQLKNTKTKYKTRVQKIFYLDKDCHELLEKTAYKKQLKKSRIIDLIIDKLQLDYIEDNNIFKQAKMLKELI